jgi:hypothetical protein
VANLTASTPKLLEEVTRRDLAGSGEFLLLIPTVHEHKHPDWTPEVALRLLKRAAPHAHVQAMDPGADALAALERAIEERNVDEVIVSTVPTHLGEWLGRDLPHRIRRLGLPVAVIPPEVDRSNVQRFRELLEKSGAAAGGGPGYGGS